MREYSRRQAIGIIGNQSRFATNYKVTEAFSTRREVAIDREQRENRDDATEIYALKEGERNNGVGQEGRGRGGAGRT